jgi:hypothetical protein
MAYCSRTDVEAIFGAANILKWADPDNTGDSGIIDDRITYCCNLATTYIDSRLRGGLYVIPFDPTAPADVTEVAARRCGIILYQNRGPAELNAMGNVVNLMGNHQKEIDKFIKGVTSGQLRLDPAYATLVAANSGPANVHICAERTRIPLYSQSLPPHGFFPR